MINQQQYGNVKQHITVGVYNNSQLTEYYGTGKLLFHTATASVKMENGDLIIVSSELLRFRKNELI